MVRPVHPLGDGEDAGPAGAVNVNALRVLVVAQQRLRVLPAVDAADSAPRAVHHSLERLALAVAPVGALDVRRLDLAAVVDDVAVLVDEGLRKRVYQPT